MPNIFQQMAENNGVNAPAPEPVQGGNIFKRMAEKAPIKEATTGNVFEQMATKSGAITGGDIGTYKSPKVAAQYKAVETERKRISTMSPQVRWLDKRGYSRELMPLLNPLSDKDIKSAFAKGTLRRGWGLGTPEQQKQDVFNVNLAKLPKDSPLRARYEQEKVVRNKIKEQLIEKGFVKPPKKFKGFWRELGRLLPGNAVGTVGGFAGTASQIYPFDINTTKGGVTSFSEIADKLYNISQKEKYTPSQGGGWRGVLAQSVASALPYMTASMVAGLVAGPIGPFSVGFSVEGEGGYREALAAGATEEEANLNRVIVGTINGAIESLQISQAIKFAKGEKIPLKELIRAATKKTWKGVAKAGKNLTYAQLQLIVREGLEEALQETSSIIAVNKLKPGTVSGAQARSRTTQAAIGGGIVGSLFGTGGAAINLRGGVVSKKDTKQLAESLSTTFDLPVEQTTKVVKKAAKESASENELGGNVLIGITKQMEDNVAEINGKQKLDEVKRLADEKGLGPVDYLDALKEAATVKKTLENEFVKFEGVQEGMPEEGIPDTKLYTLKVDIPGHPAGSTLAEETLQKAGVELPGKEMVETESQEGVVKRYSKLLPKLLPSGKPYPGIKLVENLGGLEGRTNIKRGGVEIAKFTSHKELFERAVAHEVAHEIFPHIVNKYGSAVIINRDVETGTVEIRVNGDAPPKLVVAAKMIRSLYNKPVTKYLKNVKSEIADKNYLWADSDFGSEAISEIWAIKQIGGRIEATARRVNPESMKLADELFADEPSVIKTVEAKESATQKKLTRRTALQLGHQIPKLLKWTERHRRNFMRQLVGKRSMKDMSLKERKIVIDAMLAEAKKAGLSEEQYGGQKAKERVRLVVNEKLVDIGSLLDDAVDAVNEVAPKKKKPKRLTYKTARKGKGSYRAIKRVAVGENNAHISALAAELSGDKPGAIMEVLDGDRQRGTASVNKHAKTTILMERDGLEKAGITFKDLQEFSRAMDPRTKTWAWLREAIGKGKVKYYDMEINGQPVSMSMAELLDIYLAAQQEEGLAHLRKSGLVVHGELTGALTDAQIADLMGIVAKDSRAKAIADLFTTIAKEHNNPTMNAVSNRLGKGDIAGNDAYWHLEVYKNKELAGPKAYSVSFLENQGILKERTGGGKGALVVRDAFNRFGVVQTAVAEYAGMAEHNRTAAMLLSYSPFADAIQKKGYGKILDNILELYKRAERAQGKDDVSRAVAGLLNGVYRATFTGNVPVILSQYMSTLQYNGIVDKKYASLIGHGSKPAVIKEMLNHNPTAWIRYYLGHQSIEMAELGQVDATLKAATGKSADINKATLMMKWTDILALADGWKIAKAMAKDAGLTEGTDAYWNEVNKTAEDLWLRTQPSWDKWNRSINTSDPSILRQTLFLFRSYYEKTLSMLLRANAGYRNSEKTTADKAKLTKVYGGVFASLAANALIRNMVSRLWKPDQDIWDLLYDMATSPLPLIAIFGKFLQSMFRGKVLRVLVTGKQGFTPEAIGSLPQKVVNTIARAPGDFAAAAAYGLRGDTNKAKAQMTYGMNNLYRGLGQARGVPVYQINRARRILGMGEEKAVKKGAYAGTGTYIGK